MFDAAKAYAKSKGMSPDDFKGPLNQAAELCEDLRATCRSYYKGEYHTKLDFLPRSNIRLDNLKHIEMASYGRDDIESYVENYLQLPFRSPVMERTLAELLMFYEASHFTEEMYKRAKDPFSRSPFKRHVLAPTLIGLVVSVVVFGGPAAAGRAGRLLPAPARPRLRQTCPVARPSHTGQQQVGREGSGSPRALLLAPPRGHRLEPEAALQRPLRPWSA
jgi:hypothetical protein